MPRFNPNKWKPTDDSTPGLRTVDPRRVVLHVPDGCCPCGCATPPLGAKTTFNMGHDARLRGVLIRAHLMGVEIREVSSASTLEASVEGGLAPTFKAEDVAARHGWKKYLDAAVLRRDGKNREVLRKALGSERLIRVGKWDFTGQVAAVYRTNNQDMFEIEYVDPAGEIRHKRVPAAETEEITSGRD